MSDNEDRKDLDDDQQEVEGATPAQQNEDELERQRKLDEEKRQRAEAARKRREDQAKKANVIKAKDEPTKPSTVTPAAKKPIREDIVNSCVNFLNHPKVKNSPQSQKVLFLQKKGLTQDEIDEAIRRASTASASTPAAPVSTAPSPAAPSYPAPPTQAAPYPGYPAPYPYYPPPQQQQQLVPASQSWTNTRFGFLVTAATCLSVGAGIAFLARKYIFSDKEAELKLKAEQAAKEEERRKKEEEDRKANMKVLEEMVSTLKTIQAQNSEMSELVKTYQTQVNEWRENSKKTSPSGSSTITSAPAVDNYSKMMMSEMQSQLNALKAQVIDMKSNQQAKPTWSPVTSKPAIPSWQIDSSNSSTTTSTTTTTSSNPSAAETKPEAEPYPKDFQRIMQMVQNGQTPPGIRDINDKPVDPNAKVERGVRESPVKPWAKTEDVPTSTATTTTTTTTTTSAEEPKVVEVAEQQ